METKETTIVDIEWRISPSEDLLAIFQIEPIYFGKYRIERVCGFYEDYVKTNGIYPGAVVKVRRPDGIIPFISEVVKPVFES
jgi:NAD-dependent DNA ligase